MSIGVDFQPFSDEVKYSILGVSVFLFLVAVGILGWQIHRYCTRTRPHGIGNGFLRTGDEPATKGVVGKEIPMPDFKVGRMQDETQRLSRCLSAGSLPSNSGSVEADGLAEDGLAEDSGEEDRIRGSLRFSLFYDQLRSRLVVTVLGAQRLPTRDFSCSVDPFVHVRLLRAVPGEEDGEGAADEAACCVLHEWRSRLVKGCSSPAFGDEFSCTLAKDEVPSVTVRMEVRDFDRYSRHGVLGEIRAPLDGLDISYPLEVTEDLAAPRKRLEVGLLKVRAFCRQVANDKALYARICVVCNRRKLQHQSTSLRTRWDVTVFNETVTFTLPDQPVRECAVTVSVYEVAAGRKSSRRLVGQAALGKAWGSEDEHWRLMMRSLRQTVARWHPLYI
ncbi:hypothetical protein Z043_113846 [Scleropages formosus]|uniref:C2 domain-containing protein n=1 Tax=Scleropages formosus TaxID=113540 RepID=A0A0P7UBK8_SCLFO|nr:hypothetical protein Z043_113846 [Scleropages formosus]